eukprot:COSAG01_NODE_3860_length_5618_cov_2.958869_9_plen_87_part_00
MTDKAVQAMAAACPRLTYLNLTGCTPLTDEAVRAVAAACPRLTSLNLTGCKAVTDEVVQAVVAAWPQLKPPILNRASMGTLDYSMK